MGHVVLFYIQRLTFKGDFYVGKCVRRLTLLYNCGIINKEFLFVCVLLMVLHFNQKQIKNSDKLSGKRNRTEIPSFLICDR